MAQDYRELKVWQKAGEFRQFLRIARGSACELLTQIHIAKALETGNNRALDEAETISNEVSKMLFSFI